MSEVESLKAKAITASIWAVIEKFSLMATQFIVGIVLARLLEPSDFGLIALTTIFITISNAITDGGFESALIQSKELLNIQINTAFYANIILGIFMAGILYLSAPYISIFFNESRLTNVLRILCIIMPLEALGQTQRTLLMRELNFKKISVYQMISSFVSGIVGILLAYYGYGVFALVYSTILALFIRVLCLWISSAWYPQLIFSYSSISKLIPFGLNVLATSILFFFIQQFNTLIIGKYYKGRDVGLFNSGMKFPELVISVIQSVILKMSLPMFAKLQDEDEKLASILKKTNSIVAFISFPLLLFLFLNAKEIVLLLLTSKWIEAVVYFKMFCIIKLFEPFISIQRDLLLAKGKSKLSFHLSIFTSLLETIPILIFVRHGIMFILWVVFVSKIVQFLIYLLIDSKRHFSYLIPYFKLFISYTFICILVTLGIKVIDYSMHNLIKDNIFQKLIINTSAGGCFYFILCFLFRNEDMLMLKSILASVNIPKFSFLKR